MRRLRTLLSLLLAAGLLAPAGALASSDQDFAALIKAYQAKGEIDGCAFSAKKLASAKKGVPPDIDTYAPDFVDALDAASRQRASGDCDKAAPARKTAAGAAASGAAGGSAAARGSGGVAAGAAPAPVAAAGAAPGAAAAAGAPAGAATGAASAATPAPAPEPSAAPAAADGSVATAAKRTRGSDDVPFPLLLLAVLAALGLLVALLWALARFLAVDPPWFAAGRHATSEAGWRASASWAEFTDWVRLGR